MYVILLSQWLETRPNRSSCPVCKAGISRDKVIPLYGRGSGDQVDPRDKTPPRPQGQRSEPENTGVRWVLFVGLIFFTIIPHLASIFYTQLNPSKKVCLDLPAPIIGG